MTADQNQTASDAAKLAVRMMAAGIPVAGITTNDTGADVTTPWSNVNAISLLTALPLDVGTTGLWPECARGIAAALSQDAGGSMTGDDLWEIATNTFSGDVAGTEDDGNGDTAPDDSAPDDSAPDDAPDQSTTKYAGQQAELAAQFMVAGIPIERIIVHRAGGRVVTSAGAEAVAQLRASAAQTDTAALELCIRKLTARLSRRRSTTLSGAEALEIFNESGGPAARLSAATTA